MRTRGTSGLAGALLLAAGIALGWLTWVHWLPCAGTMLNATPFDPHPATDFTPECLARMDAALPFPFAGSAAASSLTDTLRLVALGLLATGWLVFVAGQRWPRPVRVVAVVPALCTLLLTLQPVLQTDALQGLFAWVSLAIDVSALAAFVTIVASVPRPRRYYWGLACCWWLLRPAASCTTSATGPRCSPSATPTGTTRRAPGT